MSKPRVRISRTRSQSGSRKATTVHTSVGGKKIAETRIRTR